MSRVTFKSPLFNIYAYYCYISNTKPSKYICLLRRYSSTPTYITLYIIYLIVSYEKKNASDPIHFNTPTSPFYHFPLELIFFSEFTMK